LSRGSESSQTFDWLLPDELLVSSAEQMKCPPSYNTELFARLADVLCRIYITGAYIFVFKSQFTCHIHIGC